MNFLIGLYLVAVMVVLVLCFRVFCAWGRGWGASPEECAGVMTGDAYLAGGPSARVVMTRAVSITATPVMVWPWMAQLGRGAGWYSYEYLDNGGKT